MIQIPEAAVEAAAKSILEYQRPNRPWDGWAPAGKDMWREVASAALEAAAPHMLRTVTSVAELDALSVGSVVRSDMGVVWEKDEYTEEPEFPWWASPGDSHQYPARRISLPATILHEPEAAK